MELAPPLSRIAVKPYNPQIRQFPSYDEAMLSKFQRGGISASEDRRSLKSIVFQRKNVSRPEEDCRYFKLTMTENAYKGWGHPDDKEGYFLHLDLPRTVKREPKSVKDSLRVFSLDSFNLDSCKPLKRSQTFKAYNPPPPPSGSPPSSSSLESPTHVPMRGQKRARDPSPDDDLDEIVYKAPRLENYGYEIEESYQPQEPIQERSDIFFAVVKHPLKHQVKEFNILPAGVLQLMKHYQASSTPADYIIVKLVCDAKMERSDIFLTAVSAHYSQGQYGEISIPSLKVSQKMLPGRTKGYIFRLAYELQVGGKCVQKEESNDFFIWSNVNQKGYPRKERDAYINQRIEENKKKMKPKKHSPGRPKKKDPLEESFED